MGIKEIKIDKGWKILVYFDFVLPAVLYLLALISGSPVLAKLFHSYETFVISPVPDPGALTGIIGLVFHAGIIVYTILKKNIGDLMLCIIITALVVMFFLFGINYAILRPLQFV